MKSNVHTLSEKPQLMLHTEHSFHNDLHNVLDKEPLQAII